MLSSSTSRLLFIFLCSLGLFACGGGGDDDDNTTTPVVETFSVSLTPESVSFEPGNSQVIEYTITREGDTNFAVEVSLTSEPQDGSVTLDTANNRLTYSSDVEGEGSFSLLFQSASLQINRQVVYQVETDETDTNEPDPDPDPVLNNDQDYIIHLPSDYITIFEDESITLDIKRNYEMQEQIIEEFYFNTDNINGSVSEDGSQMTLSAVGSEEDTYGEVTAVTNVNGVLHETKMYVIYYNKNRDLTTTEPPVVALLEHEIRIAPYATTVKSFDIFDPDSDRISFRVLSSPNFAETHMMKVEDGYELTIHAIDDIDPTDNDVVLEVSDAHNTDIHTFNLIEDTSITNDENQPPELSIEENVTVSLIREFTGNETGIIAELAFVHSDPDGDDITLTATASVDDRYTFNIQPPYLYVTASDISDLQYDQITLVASDGQFDTKLTFHFYIQDNFLTFLGGNPNTAPMTDLPTELDLLEGQRYEIPFTSYDHESHPFDVGVEQESAFVDTLLTDTHLVLTASEPEITTQSSITIWLEDVFESRREHTITLNILKNTAPTVALDFTSTDEVDTAPYAINEVEQTPVEVEVTVTDPDEPDLQPEFSFDSSFITIDYDFNSDDGLATINSRDLTSDYSGQVVISATDEFGVRAEQVIEVDYQFKDPNNQFPVITIAQETFELLPGESGSTTVTIVDPEGDPLVIDSLKDSDDVTYTYNVATGVVNFTVSDTAAYEQELNITITASDGFGLSQKNIVITVPKSPEAPTLVVDFYEQEVPEEDMFVITFEATDGNNEDIDITTNIPLGTDLTVNVVITSDLPGAVIGYLEVTPAENVLSDQDFNFTLVATDEAGEIDSENILITVQPVNDPPELEFVVLDGLAPGASGEIILSNDTPVTLSYGIKDPDTTGQDVRVIYSVKNGTYEAEPGLFKPYAYFIEDFVTLASNEIRINGNSKEDVFGYISANKGSLAVNGDTFADTITVQVQEDIGDGSGSSHGDDLDVNVTLEFVNNKPVVAAFDLIQLLENRTQTINLSISDADIADRTTLVDGDEEICITINNASSFIEVWDVRPTPAVQIALGTPYCDTDPEGPLTQVRIDTLTVTADESEFFTLNVTDGFENESQIIQVEILNN